jgi:hypothetical protein
MTDGKTIAIAQPVRCLHAMTGSVQESAVGGNIVQPITTIFVADFTMLVRNESSRIRQGPVEMSGPPDGDGAFTAELKAHRTAIRQSRFVDQLKSERHGTFGQLLL